MKKPPIFLAVLLLCTTVVFGGSKPQQGTIVSQTSVTCGAKKSKKQDLDVLCQQYVVRSGTTDYTIRQPKPSDQTLIPLNTLIQFTLDKNKMKFKADGKSFEFIVVSQAAASSTAATLFSSGLQIQRSAYGPCLRIAAEGQEETDATGHRLSLSVLAL